MIALTQNEIDELVKEISGADNHIQNIEIVDANSTYLTVGQVLPVYANSDAGLYCIDASDSGGEYCAHYLADLVIDGVIFKYVGLS